MRTLSILVVSLGLIFLVGCGSSSPSAPQNPVFTSTPVLAASQNTSYIYGLTATDPAGGTVTFSLVTAPAGAAISGNTITWGPTAAQSRVANAFEAKATTSSGGTATQSWSVTPTGTVTVNWVDTNWTPSGPQLTPSSSPVVPYALVPQPDGSLTLLTGNLAAPGVYTILQVPAGYYFLIRGGLQGPSSTGFWTSSSTVDWGRDLAGWPPDLLSSPQTTTFDFSLSGLDPSLPPGVVGFTPDNVSLGPIFLSPDPGATSLTTSDTITGREDWSRVNTAFILQYEPMALGPFNNLVIGPEVILSDLAFVNGGTNTVTAALAPSPQTSLNLSVPGSQWASLFQNVASSPPPPLSSWLSVVAEPYVIGVNTSQNPFGLNVGLVQPNVNNGMPPLGIVCPGMPFFISDFGDPAIFTDQDFGNLQYGDPFPSEWTRATAFCQSGFFLFELGGVQYGFALNLGEVVPPSNNPLAPLAFPVVNPTINGSDFFTTATVNTTTETLSWTAPGGSTPYGYTVYVLNLVPSGQGLGIQVVGNYGTTKTSMTLPPLTAGNYLFVIETMVDGAANMETSPYRSKLPTGFATVISNAITVSSGAKRPQLHGDPKDWDGILHPRGQRYWVKAHQR